VNQKIEGFFDLCKARGLTGKQGVMIPVQNVRNLMLRQDLVEAVAAGQFRIYSVSTVDEGIEILTGFPAGQRDERNVFEEGTVNGLVERRLKEFAKGLRKSSKGEEPLVSSSK
jgi:predicted ATP-dependent protease